MINSLIPPAFDCVEAIRLRHIRLPQDQRIHDTENHRICANGQSQRQNGGDGESRRLAQHAKAEAKVLHKGLEKIAAKRFVGFLPISLIAPKLDPRTPFCLCTIEAGAFKIIRAEQKV
jgi:hypothetical protein